MKVRKKTYKISLQYLDYRLMECFAHSKYTPLPIISINGIKPVNIYPAIPTMNFPNPDTSNMVFEISNKLQPTTKFSSTIVEYLDVKNNTILYLFPDGSVRAMISDPATKMNNNMRRDLQYQIQLRKNMITMANQRHK